MSAIALAAVAGLSSGLGPCIAPRYVALASLAPGRERWQSVAIFIAGLTLGYDLLGTAAGELVRLTAASRWTYLASAVLFGAGGLALVHTAAPSHRCRTKARASIRPAGFFLLGVSGALVVSPCCTPLVAGLGARGDLTALTVFSLAHALPLALVCLAGARVGAFVERVTSAQAPRLIGGATMLAFAGLFAVAA